MREIKFRAWGGSKMYYAGELINLGLGEFANFYIGLSGNVSLLEDDDGGKSGVWEHEISDFGEKFILMQYTGLKDKNGVEIYEGDIYKLTVGDKYWVHVVKTFDGQFGVMLFGALLYKNFYVDVDTDEFVYEISYINAGTRSFVHSGKDVEVIGNIYENKV